MDIKARFTLAACIVCGIFFPAAAEGQADEMSGQAFFLRDLPSERGAAAYFVTGNNSVYTVNTPNPSNRYSSYWNDAAFLEIGESLLKIQENTDARESLFTAFGKMTVDD
jgi:hypothetical protein